MTVLCGLQEEIITAQFTQVLVTSLQDSGTIYAGLNSTTAQSGVQGTYSVSSTGTTTDGTATAVATAILAPNLGINTVVCLESASSCVFEGTNSQMSLNVSWRG
jgi:hypothetical protein